LKNYPDAASKRFVVQARNTNGGGQANNRTITAYAICMKVTNA